MRRGNRKMTEHKNKETEEMLKLQAFEIMWNYVDAVGSKKVELWCEQDKEIMRECLLTLFKG